jgi:hypothetical protein
MKVINVASTIFAVAISSSALAENQVKFGVNYSALDTELSVENQFFSISESESASAVEFVLENRFNKNFGLEGVLGLGLSDADFGSGFEVSVENVFALNAVAYLQASETFEFYGKAGYSNIDFDDTDGDSASANGIGFGIGAVLINGAHELLIEYYDHPDGEYDNFPDIEVNASSVKLGYRHAF